MANKTTQPIRDRKKIDALLAYLKGRNYRDYMIAKIELNTARRISDIVNLKVSDLLNRNGKLRECITFREQKTDKEAKVAVNTPLQNAITQYISEKGLNYSDYLFQSRKGYNMPLSKTQVHRIFQNAGDTLNIPDFGTHSLRKTWGYFCYKETRNIALIMEVYNHSSERETLRYIGITQDDKDVVHMNIKF